MKSRCTARFGGPHSPVRCDLETGHEGDHFSKCDGWIADPPSRDLEWPNEQTVDIAEGETE